MKMTVNPVTISIYNDANEKFQTMGVGRRWGQVLWNTAEDYVKRHCTTEIIEAFLNLKSTDADCYYSDLRVENFIHALDSIFYQNVLQ